MYKKKSVTRCCSTVLRKVLPEFKVQNETKRLPPLILDCNVHNLIKSQKCEKVEKCEQLERKNYEEEKQKPERNFEGVARDP